MTRRIQAGHHRVVNAAAYIRAAIGDRAPRVAVVLGSGLGELASAIENPVSVLFREIPGFPDSAIPGHAGRMVFGQLEGVPVALQCGRLHLYEGHAAEKIALPVRVLAALGLGSLIVTNAAGCLRAAWKPPTLMLIADHINLMFSNPLIGPTHKGEIRFPDMSEPYDPILREIARQVALEAGIALREGTYAGVLGPNYDTRSEIRMLARFGADAVGMSTVPEVLAARAAGVRVLAISNLSNLAAGLAAERISHAEVLMAGAVVRSVLELIVRGVLRRI